VVLADLGVKRHSCRLDMAGAGWALRARPSCPPRTTRTTGARMARALRRAWGVNRRCLQFNRRAVHGELSAIPGLTFPRGKAVYASPHLRVNVSAFYGSTSAKGAHLSDNTALCDAVLKEAGVKLEPRKPNCVLFHIAWSAQYGYGSVGVLEECERLVQFLAATANSHCAQQQTSDRSARIARRATGATAL